MSHEAEPTRDIQCEFCGEFFENRKGLSSHARSHLRQMGITEWSVNGSPIDTLREFMHKRGASSPSHQGLKKELGRQGAASPPWENAGVGPRPSASEGLPSFPLASKFRKSPPGLPPPRLPKQGSAGPGLAGGGPSLGVKGFRASPLGKKAPQEEAGPEEAGQTSPLLPKSTLPPGFCFKTKSSPEKHGASPQGRTAPRHTLFIYVNIRFKLILRDDSV